MKVVVLIVIIIVIIVVMKTVEMVPVKIMVTVK